MKKKGSIYDTHAACYHFFNFINKANAGFLPLTYPEKHQSQQKRVPSKQRHLASEALRVFDILKGEDLFWLTTRGRYPSKFPFLYGSIV